MMTCSKRRMLLGFGVALAGAAVLMLLCLVMPDKPQQARPRGNTQGPGPDQYAIQKKFTPPGTPIVKVDGSFQFTFKADTKISPGSLVDMTERMRESEIEIATQLNRKIEIP